ncbi:MAG: hypothetical protein HOQ28_00055 [Thermoleophilia bacterium]|nr:hypothetical protein [Thermoleophilia bacterium]
MGKTPSRLKRLGAWIIIVPALSLFSFSIVANAAGLRSGPDIAKAAKQVVQQKHDAGRSERGGLVIVDSSHDDDGVGGVFGNRGREVCWISTSQLARVSAVYRTTTSSVTVGQATYSLVTVYGADEESLRSLLGTGAVQCRLAHARRLFFLPFDPNLS